MRKSLQDPNQLSLELLFAPKTEKPEAQIEAQPEHTEAQPELVLPEKATASPAADTGRDEIFDTYQSLGQTVKLENDRGFPNMHRRRAANFQQFFTPFPIVRFLTRALALDVSENLIVLDNACGIGGMFRYLPSSTRIKGIELEKKAFETAIRLSPGANIIHDNLIHHVEDVEDRTDVALINPPFSIHIEKESLPLENAQWGVLGPKSSVQSHIAAVEIALRSAYLVGAMLPEGFFSNESTRTVERWINKRASLILKVDIPGCLFKESGFEWPCSVAVWQKGYAGFETKTFSLSAWEELDRIREEWVATLQYQHIKEWVLEKAENPSSDFTLEVWKEQKARRRNRLLPITEQDEVKICLSPSSSSVVLKPNGLLAALKVQEYQDDFGALYNQATRRYVSVWLGQRRSQALLEEGSLCRLAESLTDLGIKVSVDPQLECWIQKKKQWLERQQTPNEQWIHKDGAWEELYRETGLRAKYPALYRQQERRLEKLGVDWLWDFQKDDVIRMSLKQHNLLVANMGLGKTRMIIALALLYGCKRNLIVLEARNIKEFEAEFKNLDIAEYRVIEKESDLRCLRKFNLIAYSRIWHAVGSNKKTFAKALKRRCGFIACDEAHNLKAADSNQALAVRSLKVKHWLLSTGTPIANYPRNIFSLLVTAWGDGTALNPYGYYAPFFTDCGVTSGTRQFKEDFVTVEWVTPQFEQTLDKGRKAREFPRIKDIDKWQGMLAPKMIRRQNDEPEVAKSVTMPKAVMKTIMVRPDAYHMTFYRKWLDEFASWFEKQLAMEEEGHKFDQVMLLVQLGKLQFVSTIPQSARLKGVGEYEWKGGLTEKQKEAVALVEQALAEEEKVIVFSERPELCALLAGELGRLGIPSRLFTGEQSIPVRNASLEDFKFNGIPVLLATTTCGETGLNIPQASTVVMTDTSWTPSKQRQAYSRILRPQQKKQPKVFLLRNKGTIDEYMQQLMDVKQDAIDHGIDRQESSFDPEAWLSYKDFSYKMLREEGLI